MQAARGNGALAPVPPVVVSEGEPHPKPVGSRTTVELVAAACEGSHGAYEDLVARHQEPLFRFLCLRAASREDAEELTQETFLRAWQRIHRYDSRWKFSTWLFTIGRRLTVSRYRRAQHVTLGDEALVGGLESSADDPARVAGLREERENLWAVARSVLGEEQCTALWLRYAEDLSTREIGAVLERREATVRVILFRARRRLAGHLESMRAATSAPSTLSAPSTRRAPHIVPGVVPG